MKYMIASDIHGSEYYADLLRKAFYSEKADRLILLGDLLYHGPRNDLPRDYNPKGVIGILNGLKEDIIAVRGNCDAEVDQMVLDFPIMADYTFLPYGERTIYFSHGHIYGEETPLKLKKGDILICGHTHVPKCTDKGDFIYMNPGSVSIPKEMSPHGYMTLEDNSFSWKSFDDGEWLNYEI